MKRYRVRVLKVYQMAGLVQIEGQKDLLLCPFYLLEPNKEYFITCNPYSFEGRSKIIKAKKVTLLRIWIDLAVSFINSCDLICQYQ